jgi:hypothetical protein
MMKFLVENLAAVGHLRRRERRGNRRPRFRRIEISEEIRKK